MEKLAQILIGGAEAWGEVGGGVAMEGFDGEKKDFEVDTLGKQWRS